MAETLTPERSHTLGEFARTCRTAARAVGLYPAAHPAISSSLSRVVQAAAALAGGGPVTVAVLPDALHIGGAAAARPETAIAEFAGTLHARRIGELTFEREADGEDWHAFLLLLATPVEELLAAGGISKAWSLTGRTRISVREIDYAEVLRDRGAGDAPAWDEIIQFCLAGDTASAPDDRALASLLQAVGDVSQFSELIERVQAPGGPRIGAKAAALLRVFSSMADALGGLDGTGADRLLQTIADTTPRMTPEMLLGLLAHARDESGPEGDVARRITARVGDAAVASFVAHAVAAERGATERLAQALEALVPESDRKERLLDLAHAEAAAGPFGQEAGFEQLWQEAASMLSSYSDRSFVSAEYARELSDARTQAIDVERVSDDPPERVLGWLNTVSDAALRSLDLQLLLDLLRIEEDPSTWAALAEVARAEAERRTLLNEAASAERLIDALAHESREPLQEAARAALARLAAGPFVRHLVLHLREASDAQVEPAARLCHTIGAALVRPLAEALATEENSRAIRRLREILLGFGAAGRHSVEQLKNSSNPSVRRTAIDLLRVFGGRDALPELASMLDDADPQVQRESVRAIVQIGTTDAYVVLERALVASTGTRDTIVQQLIGLRDDKAVPLLCHVLTHTTPRGRLLQTHLAIIDALGGLSAHAESVRTLRSVLFGGAWWAPFRTAALRRAAAVALRRLGSADALAVLTEAAESGPRGTRAAARTQRGPAPRRAPVEP